MCRPPRRGTGRDRPLAGHRFCSGCPPCAPRGTTC